MMVTNMREMKESGILSIGLIPKTWDLCRIKDLFIDNNNGIKVGPFGSSLGSAVVSESEGEYKVYGQANLIRRDFSFGDNYVKETDYQRLKGYEVLSGDIAVSMMGTIGKCSVIPNDIQKGIMDSHLIKIRLTPNYVPKYFEYLYESDAVFTQLLLKNKGSIMTGLNSTIVKGIYFLNPPIKEQELIVSFLNSKCTEIDALYTNIQSQIDSLEVYKRSVITEAVTKGLNKNVEMKDSGMAWIGAIPNHWLIEKVKYHLIRKETKNQADKQVLSVYREYGVIPKDSRDDNHNVTSEDTSKYKYVRQGNLVINKMKAWQGSMGVSDYEGIVSPAYFIYHFTDDLLLPKYIHYLFRGCYKDEFRRISGGIREGQWDLDPDEFANTMLLIPPIKEQEAIVRLIEEKIPEIESIIATKKEQLEVLSEYKKSLIYEYVTGKKEVPTI